MLYTLIPIEGRKERRVKIPDVLLACRNYRLISVHGMLGVNEQSLLPISIDRSSLATTLGVRDVACYQFSCRNQPVCRWIVSSGYTRTFKPEVNVVETFYIISRVLLFLT